MMKTKFEYEVGDTVAWISYGVIRVGRVSAKVADIKNGGPGFDIDESGHAWWGHDSQIIKVRKKEEK